MDISDSCVTFITFFSVIDRLYAIKKPMEIKFFFTNAHTGILIFATIIFVVLMKILDFSMRFIDLSENMKNCYTLIFLLLINIIPRVLTMIVNSILVREIINYYSLRPIEALCLFTTQRIENDLNLELLNSRNQLRCFINRNFRHMSRTQKLHYFVLMISAIWSVITSISFYFAVTLLENCLKFYLEISILFYLNYFVNFFIYFSFHELFRMNIIKNLCGFIKISGKNITELIDFRKRMSSVLSWLNSGETIIISEENKYNLVLNLNINSRDHCVDLA